MRLPALKNQRKSNEPSPFGRDGLLAEASFKDLQLFFHSLPASPAVRACPRTRPGKGLKFFDCFSEKRLQNIFKYVSIKVAVSAGSTAHYRNSQSIYS